MYSEYNICTYSLYASLNQETLGIDITILYLVLALAGREVNVSLRLEMFVRNCST